MDRQRMTSLAAIIFALSGCGSQTPAEGVYKLSQATTVAPAMIPGYSHEISRSRFRIGQGTALETSTPTLQRWRGSLGAFAHDPTNNWSMAELSAGSPSGPYILDASTHNQMVKSYFVSAGIPEDQIANVETSYIYSGTLGGNQTTAPVPHSLNSILMRAIDGIPVRESEAWAKMTTAGDVDMEVVFWPPIDTRVIARAKALAATIAGPSGHASYLAKLPKIFIEGGVVIHHSDMSVHSAPVAYVAFDATVDSAGYAAMHHFDENGNEYRLPHEQANTPGSR
jgi:hypothetical protein